MPTALADPPFSDQLLAALDDEPTPDLDPTDYTPRFEPSEADRAWHVNDVIDTDARLEFEALEAWLADVPESFDPWVTWHPDEIRQAGYGRTGRAG